MYFSLMSHKNRIGWALTYLKKAGLIVSPLRSVYKITEDGLKVFAENPNEIDSGYLNKFESFNGFINKSNEDVEHVNKVPLNKLEESP